jgi:hypothetical protein
VRERTLASDRGALRSAWIYAATIFLSAFLLFQVQLIIGKYFLPWFGGTPAMWTTCMFFFQTLLVVGYLYSHTLSDMISVQKQGRVHLVVLAVTLILTGILALNWHAPLLPNAKWKPSADENPVATLVLLLAISGGIPYFALSTTGPLLQSWFASRYPLASPYRLYSLSNFGSFLALLSYPVAIEPWLTLKIQASLWFGGFCIFAVLCTYCALQRKTTFAAPVLNAGHLPECPAEARPGVAQCLFWFACAACGSLLFLSTTNQICQNIAVVPLLWILPLGIYLLTLTICFDHARFYSRVFFHPLFAAAVIAAIFLLSRGILTRMLTQIAVYACILLVACMVCHGELARSKPSSRFLTLFYLMISIGGSAAGVFVVLIAPRVFTSFSEYQIALWMTALLMLIAVTDDRSSWVYRTRFGVLLIALVAAILPGAISLAIHGRLGLNYVFLLVVVSLGIAVIATNSNADFTKSKQQAAVLFSSVTLLVLGGIFVLGTKLQATGTVLASRNFYGVLTVGKLNESEPQWRALKLSHGLISHGFQFRSKPNSLLPTSYFGAQSGVAKAIESLRGESPNAQASPLRFGVIGLGVGTIAAYAQPGDSVRFYEINPNVIRIANDTRFFTYLADCPATLKIVPGDARLSMERELAVGDSPRFNLLAVDAFSGDAPPLHLLTKQAFQVYLGRLDPNGIIAVNVTNSYVDLRPVIRDIAENLGLHSVFLHSDGDGHITLYNDWVLVSRSPALFVTMPVSDVKPTSFRRLPIWTDDYSNLFRVLR